MSGAKVFVEVISSDDDNDVDIDSDGEVQYVPYVKPPPPVIDLLMSSDEEDNNNNDNDGSGKKKNRKRKKSKTYQTEDESSTTDEDKFGSSTSTSKPLNKPDQEQGPVLSAGPPPPSAVNAGQQNERMLIHAVTNTITSNSRAVNDARDGEPDIILNAEPMIVASHNHQSSNNVGVSSLLSLDDNNSEQASLPSIRIASSIFEPNSHEVLGGEPALPFSFARNGAAGSSSSVVEPVILNDAMSGTTTTQLQNAAELGGRGGSDTTTSRPPPVVGIPKNSGQQVRNIGQWLSAVGGQVKKVTPTKRKRNNAPNTNNNNNPPMMTLSPLATTNDAPAPAPRKRVSKQQRAKQRTNEEINNFLTTLGIFDPSSTSETISPSKRTKRSRQRDAFNPLTIPPVPLDAHALSLVPPPPVLEFDSEEPMVVVVQPTPLVKEVVNKRAKKVTSGLPKPKSNQSTQQTLGTIPSTTTTATQEEQPGLTPADILLGQTRFVSMNNEDVGILTRTERASLSFNISSVLNAPSTTTTTIDSDDPVPASVLQKPSSSGTRRSTRDLETTRQSTQPAQDPYTFMDDDHHHENYMTRPSYLPLSWTPAMVKLYDCTSNEDYRLSRVLSQMSDNPALWETNERQFSSSQRMNKRIRCVNCNQFGHMIWNCTEKRKKRICHLCGEEGHGSGGNIRDRGSSRCPNAVCLNCGRRQHKVTSHGCRQCLYTKKPPRCGICDTEGHSGSHCPDNWRRFFSTTSTTQVLQEEDGTLQLYGDKPAYRLHKDSYCANCGQKGHNFFHCRFRGRTSADKYIKQNPRILDELPQQLRKRVLPPPTATIVSSNFEGSPTAAVNVNMGNTIDNEQRTPLLNTDSTSTTIENNDEVEVLPPGIANKCMDPECQNTLKQNTFCLERLIKSKEHKLMRKAQEENKISSSMKPTDQVSILKSRNAIHIYTDKDDDVGQEDQVDSLADRVFKLISKLNIEAHDDKASKKVPEVITIDEDDDDDDVNNAAGTATIAAEKFTVALLESEWDLLFAESLKVDGLIARLTEKFKVNFYISKNNLMVTIENGTEENKKLAQKNIVLWLECQAANAKYVMQLQLLDTAVPSTSYTPPLMTNNKNKKKKKNTKFPRPKSRNFKKKKRLENNSAITSDLILPNSSQNHHNSNNSNNSQQSNSNSSSGHRANSRLKRKLRRQQNRQNFGQTNANPNMMNVGGPPRYNDMSYFNHNNNSNHQHQRQIPFQNSGEANRFPNPNYYNNNNNNNNYAAGGPPPPDFHPRFINHQQQQHQQGPPPPLLGDFISFRYDPPRRGGGGSGSGSGNKGRKNRGNPNNFDQSPKSPNSKSNKRYNQNRNFSRYYSTGPE